MMILMVFDTFEEADKFTKIYVKYKKMIYYTIKQFTNNGNNIEDYIHDIYILIAKNMDNINLDNEKKTQNYLITITRNYCISHWRKNKNVHEEEYVETMELSNEDDDPLNIVVKHEVYGLMKRAIDKLDIKYRAALELKYLKGLSDDDIASILNITKKNAQIRVFRAKILVRSYMEELDNEN